MIRDPAVLAEMEKEWQGVEALRKSLKLDAMVAFAMPMFGGHYPRTLSRAANNLPFVHACSVLNEVLITLADEGRFPSRSRFLGALVKASEKALPWVDFPLMQQIVNDRNDVAHRGKLLDENVCWSHIEAIHVQLSQWRIVS